MQRWSFIIRDMCADGGEGLDGGYAYKRLVASLSAEEEDN